MMEKRYRVVLADDAAIAPADDIVFGVYDTKQKNFVFEPALDADTAQLWADILNLPQGPVPRAKLVQVFGLPAVETAELVDRGGSPKIHCVVQRKGGGISVLEFEIADPNGGDLEVPPGNKVHDWRGPRHG